MPELLVPADITATDNALAWAHPIVQEWFLTKFGSATEPQIAGWPAILAGDPTLISAPTGSGKTLAAFLVCIDKLLRAAIEGRLSPQTHVVYISPLKALSNDIQKNLNGPLAEIQQLAMKRGYLCPEIRAAVRTGDTLTRHRLSMLKHPPHILVTTPESLYILLTAGKSRQNLTRVQTVIVDEIHAIADDKRGAHLALSLERLDALVCGENLLTAQAVIATGSRPHPNSVISTGAKRSGETPVFCSDHHDPISWRCARAPQRIGLSATQNPIELVASFLTGVSSTHQEAALKPDAPSPATVPSSPKVDSQDAGCPIHDDGLIVGMGGKSQSLASHQTVGMGFSPYKNGPQSQGASAPEGKRQPATIVQVGQRRTLDLRLEVPSTELTSITSIAMWEEIYDKLAALAEQHRSTLVFVNTRKLVEKISFELSNRLGEDAVAAHHGSLSRTLRLDAEQRLKSGEIKILIATASLELGIDIGSIDLVCQIATTRAVAVAMQRVGRAGHWRGAIPKGRFFATTRDDLLEQAALLRKMVAGELDQLQVPEQPVDVLMQQIVAAVGAEPWDETALYNVIRRAYPYRNLTREQYDELLALLHNGIENSRGRYGAYILRDKVQGHLHARRGSRSIAISNGGAIPDTSIFAVMLQPENVQIATLDEHFAVDSSPGDVVLLGNTSWRIQRVDPRGKVLVEDAHGAPPSIPFWEGEAPQRTAVLCDGVSDLRHEIDTRTRNVSPATLLSPSLSQTLSSRPEHDSLTVMRSGETCSLNQHNSGTPRLQPRVSYRPEEGGALAPGVCSPSFTRESSETQLLSTIAFLKRECFLNDSAALQLITYIVNGRAVLGAVPTKTTLIAERFFDEGGGQQLILHAPFGGRINKAWGLALRKRFCRGFNFELQAAATDNGINISLAEQHSFPLADVFHFLTELTAKALLEQAAIPSPLFKNRWRWAAGRSLQLLRMSKGKRIAPQIQRTRSDDLLASVFPQASACPETLSGDIEIPDHPLVREVMKDTLTEAMDLDGLLEILHGIAAGTIRCLAVDTPVPSLFAHELINAMPYAYLDEAGVEERRARSVSTRRALPDAVADGAGRLDQAAIDTVRAQLWPDLRDEHELHDLLLQLIALPLAFVLGNDSDRQDRNCHPERSEGSASSPKRQESSESYAAKPNHSTQHWPLFFERLTQQGRAHLITLDDEVTANVLMPNVEATQQHAPLQAWIATERLTEAAQLWPAIALPKICHSERTQRAAELLLSTVTQEICHSERSAQRAVEEPATPPTPATQPAPSAATALTQGWLQLLGPTTAAHLATLTHLNPRAIHQALLTMEMQGLAMRGIFEHPKPAADAPHEIEWCERRILQRIHRLTLGTLRKQIEPVTPAIFMRWLLDWHHLAPQTQLTGEEGVLAAIEQLEGFEAPAIEWERTLLPARIADYDPRWLDNLCLAGVLGWGRISPHPAWFGTSTSTNLSSRPERNLPLTLSSRPKAQRSADEVERPAVLGGGGPSTEPRQAPRRVIPTTAAPITFYLRESSEWLHHALAAKSIDEPILTQSLSPEAQTIRALLTERGAAFTADLQRLSNLTKLQTTTALWELATAGLASADGFDQLRAMMDPRRKSAAVAQTAATSLRKRAAARTTAGRWSLLLEAQPLLSNPIPNSVISTAGGASNSVIPTAGAAGVERPLYLSSTAAATTPGAPGPDSRTRAAIAAARQTAIALDAHARILLCRYGVLFRELLARESNAPKWRDLLPILRRLEARGEIRGGRFVSGAFGEQYALPEAVDSLRTARNRHAARASEPAITVAAADPLNLSGILVPGERIPAIPGREVSFLNGATVEESTTPGRPAKPTRKHNIADMLRAEALPSRPTQPTASPGLFS